MAEHVPTVKTALKCFDQLLISSILASILLPSSVRPTHTGHLNPRRRCDGKHSLKVKGQPGKNGGQHEIQRGKVGHLPRK
jgi:hypothetical protein